MFFLLRYHVCRPPDGRVIFVWRMKNVEFVFPRSILKTGYGAMSLLINPTLHWNCQLSSTKDIRFVGDVIRYFVLFWHIELLQWASWPCIPMAIPSHDYAPVAAPMRGIQAEKGIEWRAVQERRTGQKECNVSRLFLKTLVWSLNSIPNFFSDDNVSTVIPQLTSDPANECFG